MPYASTPENGALLITCRRPRSAGPAPLWPVLPCADRERSPAVGSAVASCVEAKPSRFQTPLIQLLLPARQLRHDLELCLFRESTHDIKQAILCLRRRRASRIAAIPILTFTRHDKETSVIAPCFLSQYIPLRYSVKADASAIESDRATAGTGHRGGLARRRHLYRHQQPYQPKRSPSAYPRRASKTKGWTARVLLAATELP